MPSFNEHGAALTRYAQNPINRVAKFLISAAYYLPRAVLRTVSRLLGKPLPGVRNLLPPGAPGAAGAVCAADGSPAALGPADSRGSYGAATRGTALRNR